VAHYVPPAIVDPLEAVNVHHAKRQLHAVPDAVGEFGAQAVDQKLFVEQAGQPVASGGFVELALKFLLDLVLVGQLENGARAELKAVPIAQLDLRDPLSVEERSILRA